jgi:phospholipid/cholesterol/gamma-HCH transport system substrate-binding protein
MASRKQSVKLSQLKVGIFMLAALLITGFLILNSSGSFNPFERKLTLKARFVSADGLHDGSEVQLAGVSVGKVQSVRFLPPDTADGERIEASFSVVETFDGKPITELIRTDSTANLVSTSVLGNDKMINITPGTSKGSPIEANGLLKSKAEVSLTQLTATGSDLFSQAREVISKANRGEGTLGRVVNDEALYENLDGAVAETRETMVRLQDTINKINRGEGTAGRLVNDPELYNSLNRTAARLESISGDLQAGRGTAGRLLRDEALYAETRTAVTELRRSAEKISSIADDVKLITTDIREGRGTAGKLYKDEQFYIDLKDAIVKLGSASTRIDSLVANAQAGKGTIGKLITDETLYNSINQTANNVSTFTGEGTKLLYDFRQNPKKFLRIELDLF